MTASISSVLARLAPRHSVTVPREGGLSKNVPMNSRVFVLMGSSGIASLETTSKCTRVSIAPLPFASTMASSKISAIVPFMTCTALRSKRIR